MLPLTFTQTVVSTAVPTDVPESIRIPGSAGGAGPSGVPTVLFWIFAFRVPWLFARKRIPLLLELLTVLLLAVRFMTAVWSW